MKKVLKWHESVVLIWMHFLQGCQLFCTFDTSYSEYPFYDAVHKNDTRPMLPNYRHYKAVIIIYEHSLCATFSSNIFPNKTLQYAVLKRISRLCAQAEVILVNNMITRADNGLNKYSCIQIRTLVYSQCGFILILIRRCNLTSHRTELSLLRIWCQLHSRGILALFLAGKFISHYCPLRRGQDGGSRVVYQTNSVYFIISLGKKTPLFWRLRLRFLWGFGW